MHLQSLRTITDDIFELRIRHVMKILIELRVCLVLIDLGTELSCLRDSEDSSQTPYENFDIVLRLKVTAIGERESNE